MTLYSVKSSREAKQPKTIPIHYQKLMMIVEMFKIDGNHQALAEGGEDSDGDSEDDDQEEDEEEEERLEQHLHFFLGRHKTVGSNDYGFDNRKQFEDSAPFTGKH